MKKIVKFIILLVFLVGIILKEQNIMAATGDFMVAPPASSFNINNSFAIPSSGSSSYLDSTYSNVAVITNNIGNIQGAIWSKGRMDLTKSFTYDSYLYWGRSTAAPMGAYGGQIGGDGMTFSLHNDSRGVNAIGGFGGALGAYLRQGEPSTIPLRNAISFELDPFVNDGTGGFDDGMTVNTTTPNLSRHMAFVNPSDPIGSSKHSNLTNFQTFGTIESRWVPFKVVWTPSGSNATLAITVNGVTRTETITNYSVRFNGTFAYLGYTGATGGVTALQAIAATELPVFSYNLSFSLNGATGTAPSTQTIQVGSKATAVTSPTRTGYLFSGWNTAANGSGTTWNFTTSTMPNNDVTLYAQWTARVNPTLTVPAFTEVAQGGAFNAMTGVSASDPVDGNLTSSVQVTGSVNTSVPGVYVLNYSITNTGLKTVTGRQVVLVNDGTYKAGTSNILQAQNFTKRIGQVDTTDAAIRTAANVKVYTKSTGVINNGATVNITNKGGYTGAVGDYTIGFQVAGDTTASRSILASVITGNAPVITAPVFTEIVQGASFDPRTGVSVTDVEDDDTTLTNNVNITGSVDTNTPGVYRLDYSVADSDGNIGEGKQIVLVNDGAYKAGTTTILKANDFTKRIGQVDISDVAIKAAAGTKVYNKETGAEDLITPVTIVSKGGYAAVPDDYIITLQVFGDNSASRAIVATVETGNPPILTVPEFTELTKGSVFNPRTGLSVTDVEDDDVTLTNNVTITGSVNTDIPGVYPVHYHIVDSDLNEASATQVVVVNDEQFVVGDTYILQAQDFTKRVGQVDTSDSAIKTAANVKVYDKSTGVENTSVVVNITDKGGFGPIPGPYDISFQVTGDLNASKTIIGTVETGNTPVLTVPDFTEVALNGSFSPMTGVTVTDTEDEDDDLINDIIITGSVDTSVAGVYPLNYKITDSDGNSATAKQVVVVNDESFVIGSQYMIQARDFQIALGRVDTDPAAIKSEAKVKVYSRSTGLEDTLVAVNIPDDGGYTATLGIYDITFEVEGDTQATITIEAEVNTGSIPTLAVPSFTELNVGGLFDPRLGLSADDDEDGDLTPVVDVNNPVDVNTAGVYQVTYSVTDSDLNEVTAVQIVLVNDGNYHAGATNILYAKDFTNRIGQVDTSTEAIKLDANAQVFSKISGVSIASATINVVDKGDYDAVAGTYPIRLEVGGDSAFRVIDATVISGDPPVITIPAFTELSVGDSFDPMTNFVVTDDFDDETTLLGTLNVTGVVNTSVPGVYPINYKVIDTDSNETTATQVVLVKDDTFMVGADTIITAKDFTKRIGQVVLGDEAIKSAAGFKVYDKITGLELLDRTITISDADGYGPSAGAYTIGFEVSDDVAANITITATVVTGESPVLIVPAFTEINVGDLFDSRLSVSAEDLEDDDVLLTNSISVTGTVNPMVAGVYALEYSVTDSDGNSSTARQVVLVNDGTYQAGNTKILQAKNFTKRIGQVDLDSGVIKVAAETKIYDKVTGNVDAVTLVNIIDLGGYTAAADLYEITFQVASDASAERIIEANVIAGQSPILNIPGFTEVLVNGSFDPRTGLSVTDVEDDDVTLTDNVLIEGEVLIDTPGVYTLNYSIEDSDGNTASGRQVVLVNDGFFNVGTTEILRAEDFTKRIGQVDTGAAAIKTAARVKVYDKLTGAENIFASVMINDDGGYEAKAGSYTISFVSATDATATQSILATVEKGEVPTLTAPAFTEIELGDSFDPMESVLATDVEDDDTVLNSKIIVTGEVLVNTAGIYTLQYSVTDSDGNVATATQVVLVNDGNAIVGDTYILKASDFEKRISLVDTSLIAVKAAANVKAYNKLTGIEDLGATIDLVDDGGYNPAIGLYDITFEVTTDTNATRTIVAKVTAGQPPHLVVPDFTEVSLNGSFNPMTGVEATDFEDGDIIIESLIINGSVDTSVSGVYPLTYQITDKDGNQATATQVVLVNAGDFKTGDNYIIQAEDFKVGLGYVDTDPTAIKEAANVKVYHKASGAQATEATVDITDDGGFTAALGSYAITFQVDEDAQAKITIEAQVVAGNMPILIVPNFTEIAVGDSFDPMTGVTATDSEDGILTPIIENPVNVEEAGVYTVKYKVTDSDYNTVTASQIVLVNDGNYHAGTANILHAKNFTNRIGQVNTDVLSIKEDAEARVYSKISGVSIASATINVIDKGGYDAVEGTYDMVIEVGGDSAIRLIKATVIAGEPPVLEVPSFTEIDINTTFDVLQDVMVTDEEDDDEILRNEIKVTGDVDTSRAGIYKLAYSVTDSDGNTDTANRTILVNDGNSVYENGFIISAHDFRVPEKSSDLTESQMKEKAGVSVYDVLNDTILENPEITIDRSAYMSKKGVYSITFTYNPSITIKATVYGEDVATSKPGSGAPQTGNITHTIELSLMLIGASALLIGLNRKRKSKLER